MTTTDDATIIAACRQSADALLAYVQTIKTFRPIPVKGVYVRALRNRLVTIDERYGLVHDECATEHPEVGWVVACTQMLFDAVMRYIDYATNGVVSMTATLHCWSLLPRILPETDQREQDYLQARIGTVRGLLDQLPAGDVVSRPSLESHLAEMQGEGSRG